MDTNTFFSDKKWPSFILKLKLSLCLIVNLGGELLLCYFMSTNLFQVLSWGQDVEEDYWYFAWSSLFKSINYPGQETRGISQMHNFLPQSRSSYTLPIPWLQKRLSVLLSTQINEVWSLMVVHCSFECVQVFKNFIQKSSSTLHYFRNVSYLWEVYIPQL